MTFLTPGFVLCVVTIHHPKQLWVQGGQLPGRVQGWNPWDFAFNLLLLARFSNQADALFASARRA